MLKYMKKQEFFIAIVCILVFVGCGVPLKEEEFNKKLMQVLKKEDVVKVTKEELTQKNTDKWFVPLPEELKGTVVSDHYAFIKTRAQAAVDKGVKSFLGEPFQYKGKPETTLNGKFVYFFPKEGLGAFKIRMFYWDTEQEKGTFVDFIAEKRDAKNPWVSPYEIKNGDTINGLIWSGPIRPLPTHLDMENAKEELIVRKPYEENLDVTLKCSFTQICPRVPELIFTPTKNEGFIRAAAKVTEASTVTVQFTMEVGFQAVDINDVTINKKGQLLSKGKPIVKGPVQKTVKQVDDSKSEETKEDDNQSNDDGNSQEGETKQQDDSSKSQDGNSQEKSAEEDDKSSSQSDKYIGDEAFAKLEEKSKKQQKAYLEKVNEFNQRQKKDVKPALTLEDKQDFQLEINELNAEYNKTLNEVNRQYGLKPKVKEQEKGALEQTKDYWKNKWKDWRKK